MPPEAAASPLCSTTLSETQKKSPEASAPTDFAAPSNSRVPQAAAAKPASPSVQKEAQELQETVEELAQDAEIEAWLDEEEWFASTTKNGHKVWINRDSDEVVFNRPTPEERQQQKIMVDRLQDRVPRLGGVSGGP